MTRWTAAGRSVGCGLAAALILLANGSSAAPRPAPQAYDVILRGGTVIDGTGRPRYRADVGIRGGHIARIGKLTGQHAPTEVDATGLFVAPGFINIHSHAEPAALPRAANMLTQGVTTEILNPDGFGTTDIAGQLRTSAAAGLAVNIGAYVGFNAVWEAVVGRADQRPTPADLAKMQQLVLNNLAAGAWGVSGGLDYKPAYYATEQEVIDVLKVAAPWRTAFPNHERVTPEQNFSSHAGMFETLRIGEKSGVAPYITHIKSQGEEQGKAAAVLHRMDALTTPTRFSAGDVYPYLAGQTGLADLIIPGWAQDGGRPAMLERFKDPVLRARVAAEAETAIKARWNGPQGVYLPETQEELTALMARDRVSAGEAVIRALEKAPARVILRFGVEADLVAFLKAPNIAVACDCGAAEAATHPRYFGAFPRVLGRYVRDQRVTSWEDGVRKMTGLPASLIGMVDRGVLAPGMAADVTLFDPRTIIDKATFEQPMLVSTGVRHVLIGGKLALRDGRPTGVKAGTVLKRGFDMPIRRMTPADACLRLSGEVADASGQPRKVAIEVREPRDARAASGAVTLALAEGNYRMAAPDLGVLQTTVGWASLTGVATGPDGGRHSLLLIADKLDGAGPQLRVLVDGEQALAGALNLSAAPSPKARLGQTDHKPARAP